MTAERHTAGRHPLQPQGRGRPGQCFAPSDQPDGVHWLVAPGNGMLLRYGARRSQRVVDEGILRLRQLQLHSILPCHRCRASGPRISFSNASSARSNLPEAMMDRCARPAMTALAYWNLMASKGMARKDCPAAPEGGAG